MRCSACSFVSKEEAPKFCSNCGQKMQPTASAPLTEQKSEEEEKKENVPV